MPENQMSEVRDQKSDSLEGSEMSQLLWPRKGDQVFTPIREDWHNNARVNWLNHRVRALELYADGYKKAGDVLVRNAMEQTHTLNLLVYPICFLYRHYLELTMKGLIARGRRLTQGKYAYPKHHNLLKLWGECRTLLLKLVDSVKLIGSVSQEELDVVEELVVQIIQVDPNGEAFRYAENKKTFSALPKHITHINVRNLMEIMERIGNFLEGTNECLSITIDYENEMREEVLRFLI